jgi:DNA-binding transcriptional LysR family regulator
VQLGGEQDQRQRQPGRGEEHVVDRGSFTAAGRALGLPTSSISRGVQHIEEELGASLLTRTTRRVGLTEAGARYVERARRALAELAEAAERVRDDRDQPHGLVRLTAPIESSGWLADIVVEVIKEQPRIQLELLLTGRRVDLAAEGVDLALRAGPNIDPTLVGQRISAGPAGLYAAPIYLARAGRPRSIAELARHAAVLYRSAGVQRVSFVGPRGRVATAELNGRLAGDEMIFVVQATERGAGIAVLPALAVADAVAAGRLEPVLPAWQTKPASMWLVHLPMRHLPRRVAVVRDALAARLRARLGAR